MAIQGSKFIVDKEELKPGLILFRRSDVKHGNWYCRVKVPKEDRYKTVSLKTADRNAARDLAWDQDGEVRYAIKHGVALFNRSLRDVAKEFLTKEEARAKRGEITVKRFETVHPAEAALRVVTQIAEHCEYGQSYSQWLRAA